MGATLHERKTTHNVIHGTVLLAWAVFFRTFHSDTWQFLVVWTVGSEVNPHTTEAVRRDVEDAYGPVEAFRVFGPYWDKETAYRVRTLALTDTGFSTVLLHD